MLTRRRATSDGHAGASGSIQAFPLSTMASSRMWSGTWLNPSTHVPWACISKAHGIHAFHRLLSGMTIPANSSWSAWGGVGACCCHWCPHCGCVGDSCGCCCCHGSSSRCCNGGCCCCCCCGCCNGCCCCCCGCCCCGCCCGCCCCCCCCWCRCRCCHWRPHCACGDGG